ncbi:hypothetical protein ACFPIJ_39610 [Dactylosporangium cerinum]|uniref:Uncharacterized protein n=1 Tax=Dactylosporangium cerinum TaxID=1434730 RepID=A0ABV9W7I4_9ACTN
MSTGSSPQAQSRARSSAATPSARSAGAIPGSAPDALRDVLGQVEQDRVAAAAELPQRFHAGGVTLPLDGRDELLGRQAPQPDGLLPWIPALLPGCSPGLEHRLDPWFGFRPPPPRAPFAVGVQGQFLVVRPGQHDRRQAVTQRGTAVRPHGAQRPRPVPPLGDVSAESLSGPGVPVAGQGRQHVDGQADPPLVVIGRLDRGEQVRDDRPAVQAQPGDEPQQVLHAALDLTIIARVVDEAAVHRLGGLRAGIGQGPAQAETPPAAELPGQRLRVHAVHGGTGADPRR